MQADRFRRAVALLALAYCVVETVYVLRLPLVMDEFDGAYEAYRLRHEVPYRDYTPYKTVVGYAIEALPAALATSVWPRILTIKVALALINTLMLAGAALYLARFFDRTAIAGALLLLIVCSNFLERSAELRVDMLTAWAGLWSLLFLLRGRPIVSGALCGLSFLISQKGALYFVAANLALAGCWILYDRTRERFREIVVFDAAFTIVIAAYVVLWSIVAPAATVIRATFFAAAGQALLGVYAIRAHYWSQILLRNPAVFVLAIGGVVVLLLRRNRTYALLALYGAVILFEGAAYKQPWPYFFPMLLPTMFVVHAALFSEVRLPRWAVAAIGIAGVLYPLTRLPVVLARDNAYQRYNVKLAGALLGPDDTYVAGTDIIHDHEQTIRPLERLDGYMLARLRAQPAPVLTSFVRALAQRPPKLFIANYRVYGMPRPLLDFIDTDYARLSGSILAYAPRWEAGVTRRAVAFGDRYQVDTRTPGTVQIDGREYRTGALVMLTAGMHNLSAKQTVRMRLLPESAVAVLDPAFVDEQQFYPNVYDY